MLSPVAGIRYENRAALLAGVITGNAVTLVRDYANQYDPNAIEVRVGGERLGYMPRTNARLLAPRMDAGEIARATVVTVDRSQSDPKLSIQVSVETGPPNEVRGN